MKMYGYCPIMVILLSVCGLASAQDSGPLKSIQLLTNQAGWAATQSHVMWTTDAGVHWRDITPNTGTKEAVVDVFFLDTSTGWALLVHEDESGEAQFEVASTEDAGAKWLVS